MEEKVWALMRELKSFGIYAQLEDKLNPIGVLHSDMPIDQVAGASGERFKKRIWPFVESDFPNEIMQ